MTATLIPITRCEPTRLEYAAAAREARLQAEAAQSAGNDDQAAEWWIAAVGYELRAEIARLG